MPLSENVQRIDEQVRATVEKAVQNLQLELLELLHDRHRQLQERLQGDLLDLPERLIDPADLEPALREAGAEREEEVRGDALAELKAAVVRIDRARSQGEILRVLLEEARRHASRSAILLAAPGRLRGWGGQGFGEEAEALSRLVLEAPEGSAWERLLRGRGVIRLASTERADLSSRLEVAVPLEAVLVPIVLRDRVAGALYVDRLEGEGSAIPLGAVETVTYVAALALETLPLRQRLSTPTLWREEEAPAGEADMEVWQPGPAAAPAVAEVEPPAPEPAVEEPAAVPAEPVAEPSAPTEAAEPPAPAEPVPSAGVEAPAVEAPAVEPEEEPEAEPAAAAEFGLEVELEEPEEEIAGQGLWTVEEEAEPLPPVEAAVPAPESPAVPVETEVEEREVTRPGTPPVVSPSQASPQVEPPSDIQGPGWAFSAAQQREGDDEARHEEARRLARLLVSEVKLYNEEQVEEGRQNHDIYERLKDDIDRSRQLYEARVDTRVREATDYFYQEMVRVLGGGDPKALGI